MNKRKFNNNNNIYNNEKKRKKNSFPRRRRRGMVGRPGRAFRAPNGALVKKIGASRGTLLDGRVGYGGGSVKLEWWWVSGCVWGRNGGVWWYVRCGGGSGGCVWLCGVWGGDLWWFESGGVWWRSGGCVWPRERGWAF